MLTQKKLHRCVDSSHRDHPSALFDLSTSNEIYEREGLEAYRRYQIANEEKPLEPGEGYLMVKKLLSLMYK